MDALRRVKRPRTAAGTAGAAAEAAAAAAAAAAAYSPLSLVEEADRACSLEANDIRHDMQSFLNDVGGVEGDDTMDELPDQDRFLPIANIGRIMKKALPQSNAKIAKDAKETMQDKVTEFICFITSEASLKCREEKRKTVNGEDVLWAMTTLDFDNYLEPLKTYLTKYRESVKGDKPDRKKGKYPDNNEEMDF